MNILFVHKSLVIGGAERILINYLNLLSPIDNLNITLLLLEDREEKNHNIEQIHKKIDIKFILQKEESCKYELLEQKIKNKGFLKKIYRYKKNFFDKILKKRIKDFIKYNNFDLIINFNSHLDILLHDHTPNIPIIRWIHGQAHLDDWRCNRNWYQNILPQHFLFVAITEEMQKNAREILESYGIKSNQVYMLYNPIDINEVKSKSLICDNLIPTKEKYLINVSRLDKDKNHEQMINIYYQLKQKGIKEKLYIIGDGNCYDELKKQIQLLNLQNDCFLLGNKDNPYPFMKKATLFLHTSLKEGLPTVIIESMACGTPVIAMDCPTGPKEILHNGKYGAVIELKNENSFVNKTFSILTNKDEYNYYINNLDEAIQIFEPKLIKQKLLEILKTNKFYI